MTLDDGTTWPSPTRAGVVEWTLRYGDPTRADLLVAAEIVSSYLHLATHPAGTEAAIKKLRMLRRTAAESEGS